MSKRAKRGKAETFALPMAGRVAIGAVRATGTKAVRAPGPGVVNSGLRVDSSLCTGVSSGSDFGPAASGRNTKSR
jgi:hypothetical protein